MWTPRGGWGLPHLEVTKHPTYGGWGGGYKPPSPPPHVRGWRGLHHPFQQEPGSLDVYVFCAVNKPTVDLGSSTEGVCGCVIEADAKEVGIANVVGKRHLTDHDGIAARFDAMHAILRVFGLGGNSRIGGVKGGELRGERGGGVHVLNNDYYL